LGDPARKTGKIIILLNFSFSRKKIKNTESLTVLFSTHKRNMTEIVRTILLEPFEGLVFENNISEYNHIPLTLRDLPYST